MAQIREDIIAVLRPFNPNNLDIFKSKKEQDFLLTAHGYLLISTNKLFEKTFIAKLDKETAQSISTLISLKKIFNNSPYFIKGRTVFYFDDMIHTQICMHGSLQGYIDHIKLVESFNRK